MESLAKNPPYVNGTPYNGQDDTSLTQDAVYEAFNSVPIGMIITDENARILHINRTADELVRQHYGLVVHNRMLSADTRAGAARLRETISDVVTKARYGNVTRARAISLYRSSCVHPLSIIVKPMWCTGGRDPGQRVGPLANLLVADLDRRMEAPADLLRRVFDLTLAESVVLERLVYGLSLQEIANALGTSRNTVRNQLQVVFEKTGTNRQSELIKLVLSTAIWMYGEEKQSDSET